MTTVLSTVSERDSQTIRVRELAKTCYQDAQQVKLMTLQAEVDSLLAQLQNLKEQRLATTEEQ
ncbi:MULTISPECIES: hypothetical protein [unclassified Anabaena]|uniref:hypothetical protein n=1 Tax=unclassified Anabaena TaxID=2619674 RepID=UPI000835D753|nr:MULTISPECIES: hypothetical protein [unclassified Anabaena]